ncbi:hypothetical protein ACQUFY_21730 [Robbsia andropogonis]|uniref:hypothetical protein n=1 Tax=Robbsia andropogonis TaxID=28092 RepID=UPI003D22D4C1
MDQVRDYGDAFHKSRVQGQSIEPTVVKASGGNAHAKMLMDLQVLEDGTPLYVGAQSVDPVARVCETFTLAWEGRGPIAPIIEKHGIKVGDPLYAAPPSVADVRDAALEEACAAIKAADDKQWEDDYMLDSDDCIKVIRALKSKKEA